MQFNLFSSLIVLAVASGSASGNNALNTVFEAVKNDDGEAIRSAVENDPSMLESIGQGGQTPLINAVLTGKINAVKTLLEINADASATEQQGYNVLHAAGFQGRTEILELLLEHFAKQKEAGGFALDPKTDKHGDGFYPMHVS
jgi:ankyrin repeat protein